VDFLLSQFFFQLTEAIDGRFHGGGPVLNLLPLLIVMALFIFPLCAETLDFPNPALQVGFGLLLTIALFDKSLLLAAEIVFLLFEPGAECGQQCLLSFDISGPLGCVRGGRVMSGLSFAELGSILMKSLLQLFQLLRLGFHLSIGLLELTETAVDLRGSLLQLFLFLLQGGGQAIQPKQIRLIFRLVLFQDLPIFDQLALARLAFADLIVLLFLQGLLAGGKSRALFVEVSDFLVDIGSPGVQLGFTSGMILKVGRGLSNFRLELAFALLDIGGRFVDRLLKSGQPVAPLPIAVVKLLAISIQLFFLSD